jgi:hypothetical protein
LIAKLNRFTIFDREGHKRCLIDWWS